MRYHGSADTYYYQRCRVDRPTHFPLLTFCVLTSDTLTDRHTDGKGVRKELAAAGAAAKKTDVAIKLAVLENPKFYILGF